MLSRLGAVGAGAGDRKTAAQAYLRVYYEFALTDAATAAASQLATLQDQIVRTGYQPDLGRAAMLFGARRYAEARTAFQEIQKQASGDDRELADLRVAECDFHLKRYEAARDGVRPYLERASRKAEARFFHLSALRELGQHDEYVAQTRALVAEFPDNSWAEEALNNLGTHYILTNQDDAAARVFGELYEKFPTGPRAERAAWKYGWWSYRNGDYADDGARRSRARPRRFPAPITGRRSCTGRRGRTASSGTATRAGARFRLVYHDYGNSYYGRLAQQTRRSAPPGQPDGRSRRSPRRCSRSRATAPRPPTADRIRLLLANGLYDDALAELRYAQRQWGTSPAIEATIAWAYHQKGELRRAITLMRRAYPQSLTSGGHQLPVEMRQVIFPLVYWDLIRKHANAYDLDPYVIAALIAQESTFDPDDQVGRQRVGPDAGRAGDRPPAGAEPRHPPVHAPAR